MASVRVVVHSGAHQRHELDRPNPWPRTGEHTWYVVQTRRVWRPPTDVYETDSHIVVKVEIAGMDKDDFRISLVDRRLIIAGHRRDPVGKLIYQNMEIHYGEFRTGVKIDWPVDEAAIEASYESGFIFVMLPKETKRRRIQVTVHGADADQA